LLLLVAGAFAFQPPNGAARENMRPKTSAVAHVVSPAPPVLAPAPVKAFTLQVDPTPQNASITLDGESLGTGYIVRTLPRDGRSHTIVVSAEGYRSRELHFTDAAPIADVMLELIPAVTTPPPAPPRVAWVARRGIRNAVPSVKQHPATSDTAASAPRATSNGAPIVY
jgi:hypothetical protein